MEESLSSNVEGNSGDVANSISTPTIPQQPLSVSSNIRVVCRVRPLTDLEIKKNEHSIVHFHDTKSLSIRANGPQFTFDRIFDFKDSQVSVFEDVAAPIVKDFLDGYHGTIIAYGQTASGKTFTMVGEPSSHGIIPRVIENIFNGITQLRESDTTFSLAFCLKISALELYNEKLYDLYDANKSNLSIREHKQNGIYVEGISEKVILSIDEAYDFLNISNNNRAIAATKMSAASSRSHSVLMIELSQQNLSMESSKISKLFLVDLAGSERAHKTGAEGDRMQEAKNINLSLSALGKVINALTCGASYIPYRDSKLTRVLQDSLGGNSKTSLIINCSPSNNNEHETITTLQFGTRAKTIKNQAKINKKITYHELELFIIRLAQDLEKSRKETEEVTRSKNLEINNLLIQLENNQKLIVESNQKLEYLNSQNQLSQSINNSWREIENTTDNDKIILDDLNDHQDLNFNNNNNDNQEIEESIMVQQEELLQEDDVEDENLENEEEEKNNLSYSSIKVDDLRDLNDMPDIKDIILNSNVVHDDDDDDDSSDTHSFDDSDKEYLDQSKEIKVPTIDFSLTSPSSNSGNHLRVSTSYITSSPNVSPRTNVNENSNNNTNNNNECFPTSSTPSPPIVSYFKTKDFPSLQNDYDKFLNEISKEEIALNSGDLETTPGSGNSSSASSSSGDSEINDSENNNKVEEDEECEEDEEDSKSTSTITSTTTTTTTIDMNANQPSGIEDPIEFTIIKSAKTVTSTLEKEIIQPPSVPLFNDNQDHSSLLPAPPLTTATATLTTITTTKLTKTTNKSDVDIDDFGFSKIEEQQEDVGEEEENQEENEDNHKPNSLYGHNESMDVIVDDSDDQNSDHSNNNLLNSFKNDDHHRGDFGATPIKSNLNNKVNNNNRNNENYTIKEFETPISSKSQPLILQSTSINNNDPTPTTILYTPLATTNNSTNSPPVDKKKKKSFTSVYLPWLSIMILLLLVTAGYLQLPEYKDRLAQRRIHLDTMGIYSDYPTLEKLSTYKRNQILLAKELYGHNSKEYDIESTLINTAYNTLNEMNYLETAISKVLGSSIGIRFFDNNNLLDKTMNYKRRVHKLEQSSSPTTNSSVKNIEIIEKQLNEKHELEIKKQTSIFELEIQNKSKEIKQLENQIKEKDEKIERIESSSQDVKIFNVKISQLESEKKELSSKVEQLQTSEKSIAQLEGDKKALGTLVGKMENEKKELLSKLEQLQQLESSHHNYPIIPYPTVLSKAKDFIIDKINSISKLFNDIQSSIKKIINS